MLKKIPALLSSKAIISIPIDPNIIVEKYLEYAKCREQEITKRKEISAWKAVEVEKIRSEKECLIEYLRLEYKTRADVYEKGFAALDKAIDSGNPDAIHRACALISQQIAQNPFSSLQEFRQNRLEKKELDF